MSRQFSAVILLKENWPLDIDAIAAALRQRFDGIGQVAAIPGQAMNVPAGLIDIDGGQIVVTQTNGRHDTDLLHPPLDVMRSWDPAPALEGHKGYLTISCGGGLPGIEGAEAYAAAVHFVAAAALTVAPASAVFWAPGYALTAPEAFLEAADALKHGRMPLACWVSSAAVVPQGYAPQEALGMVTYGMRPFLGREIELAPRPGDARSAYHCLSAVAGRVLSQGLMLQDGDRLRGLDGSFDVSVRERTYWLRREMSAYVLIADDAVVDPETLRPRAALPLSA